MHYPRVNGPRFVINSMLIFADGFCTNEGSENAAAGYGFAYSAKGTKKTGWMPGRVEFLGPEGVYGPQTVNRAELRAVIAALEWRYWYREGWEILVIATSMGYVYDVVMQQIEVWVHDDWTMDDGEEVPD